MARIRTIKPEFFTSEQITECSVSARLLFMGLLVFSDDAGRHPASVKRLKMEVYPGDSFTQKQVEEWLDELVDATLVVEYESAQSRRYWWITGFSRHQKVDKPTVRFPGPFDEGSTIVRGAIPDSSPPEGSLMESNGMEGKGSKAGCSPFIQPTIEEIQAYCAKRNKGVDPEKWINHYTSNGWMVGKNHMKDWKAAVRTWERNNFGGPKQEPQKPLKYRN